MEVAPKPGQHRNFGEVPGFGLWLPPCATSLTKAPQAIRDFTRAMRGEVGNMPPLPGVFPDYFAPIVQSGSEGRELVMARWGIPSPKSVVGGRRAIQV